MNNPILTKSQTQGSAVNPYRFVVAGSDDGLVAQAVGALSTLLGISDAVVNPAQGSPVDVHVLGIAELELGDGVTRHDYLTADSIGRGVTAGLVAGTVIYAGAIALESGVVGDIIPVLVVHSILANETIVGAVDVTLTASQLKALHATPISVVPAPIAGKANVVRRVTAIYTAGTTPFTLGGANTVALRYTDANGTILAELDAEGSIDQGTSQVRILAPALPNEGAELTPVAAAAIVANMTDSEVTAGDGTVKLHVQFETISLS